MSFKLAARAVIPAFNNLSALQSWLRPGFVSFLIGAHLDALRADAVRIEQQHSAMLDEAALHYPDVISDDNEDEALRGTPHPMAGQRVTTPLPNGAGLLTHFKSPEAAADFRAREKELMDAMLDIDIDDGMRLTLDVLRKLDTERLAEPRPLNGAQPSRDTPTVDFASLMALVPRTTYTRDGVKAPRELADADRVASPL
jgi:hypothetical protein